MGWGGCVGGCGWVWVGVGGWVGGGRARCVSGRRALHAAGMCSVGHVLGSWRCMPPPWRHRVPLRILERHVAPTSTKNPKQLYPSLTMAISGAVAKPNSSAPSSAATAMSRPVFIWPSACGFGGAGRARDDWRRGWGCGRLPGRPPCPASPILQRRRTRLSRPRDEGSSRQAASASPCPPAPRSVRAGRWPPESGGSQPGPAPRAALPP